MLLGAMVRGLSARDRIMDNDIIMESAGTLGAIQTRLMELTLCIINEDIISMSC